MLVPADEHRRPVRPLQRSRHRLAERGQALGRAVALEEHSQRFAMTGTIFLGDTYYCSYGNIVTTIKKGGHCILPVERKTRMRPLRRLGRGDRLVRVTKRRRGLRAGPSPSGGSSRTSLTCADRADDRRPPDSKAESSAC